MFEHVTDHVAKGLARLPEQFQKDDFRALLTSWLVEFQEIEDAFWDLLQAALGTATGARLSQYAVLLGEPRQGLGDDELRSVLLARILANRSQGRDADLHAMLVTFATDFLVEDFEPASVLVTFDAFPGEGLPERIASLVRRAVGGGIGAQVLTPAGDADVFTLADGEDLIEDDDEGLGTTAQDDGGELAGVYE